MSLSFVSIAAFGHGYVARGAARLALLVFLLAGPPQAWSQSSEAVKIVPGNSYAITGIARTATVTMRREPSPGAPAVGRIPGDGTWIVSSGGLSRRGKDLWAHVAYKGMQGWIQSVYLTPEDGLPKNLRELYDHGIAIEFLNPKTEREKGFQGSVPPHPNKCPYPAGAYVEGGKFIDADFAISVSDAMLAHFKGRGFSLETLCLALTTEVTIDPNTGITVPGVYMTYHGRVQLNVPDCFKNGTPLLDRKLHFHWFWGDWASPTNEQKREATANEHNDKAMLYDRTVRDAFSAGKIKSGDLLGFDTMTMLFGDELAEDMHGRNPPGGISFIEISNHYPRGYAYRIWTGHTAGDGPDEIDSAGKIILSSNDMKVAVPWSKQQAQPTEVRVSPRARP